MLPDGDLWVLSAAIIGLSMQECLQPAHDLLPLQHHTPHPEVKQGHDLVSVSCRAWSS